MFQITPEISVEVLAGAPGSDPAPLPVELALTLRKVDVSRNYEAPCGFSLSFEADRYPSDTGDSADEYPALATGVLDPFCRVQVQVTIGDTTTVLMDGFVTKVSISAKPDDKSSLSVTGEDSVKMDLFEVYKEYSKKDGEKTVGIKDSEIASTVLGPYAAIGFNGSVTAPENEDQPDKPRQQQATDFKFLQEMAHIHDCIFYIEPGTSLGQNTVYWGPPEAPGSPQKALTINMGPADNLSSASCNHNGLAPTMTYGLFLDQDSDMTVQQIAIGSVVDDKTADYYSNAPIPGSLASLATSPDTYTDKLKDLSVRGTLYKRGQTVGSDFERAKNLAQNATDMSVRECVTVSGELDTFRYGGILKVRGCVDLRGVGSRFDGTYFVKKVSHSINLAPGSWSYTQSFDLLRGGTGTTISEVTIP